METYINGCKASMVWATQSASGELCDASGAVYNESCDALYPSFSSSRRSCPAWRRLSPPRRLFYDEQGSRAIAG
jgi:hypothetical protein